MWSEGGLGEGLGLRGPGIGLAATRHDCPCNSVNPRTDRTTSSKTPFYLPLQKRRVKV